MIKTQGLMSFAFNISQKEIDAMIAKFREKFPDDKRTDEELRPYAINEIMYQRCENR